MRLLAGADEVAGRVAELARAGDTVIFLGAGDITRWAHALPDELAELGGASKAKTAGKAKGVGR